MRERIKKFIATILTMVLVSQLPGFDAVVILAASKTLDYGESATITEENKDDYDEYVFYSGGTKTLTVSEGVNYTGDIRDVGATDGTNNIINMGTVSGTITCSYGTNNITNQGSINNLTIDNSYNATTVTGGEITTVSVSEYSQNVIINGCTIGTISADTSVTFEGSNTVAMASLAGTDGAGSLYVTDSLAINGEYVAMDIATLFVDKDTAIYSDKAISVMCDGKSYSIFAGFNSSILDVYGIVIDTALADATVAISADNTSGNTYLYGDTSDTIVLAAAEGYYFDEDYADGITSDGNGTINATLINDTTLNITYTFSTDDEGEVMINFPAATFKPIDGKGSLAVSDSYYGSDYTYTLSSDTNDTKGAVVQYKVKGADDSTYTTTKPTAVGSYTARVILPGNETYKELILTDDFSILKASGSATLSVADIYYGGKISIQLSSSTNSTQDVLVEYKVAGADDSTYSATAPVVVGSYTARVTLPESASYNSVVVTDDFAISYLPAPGTNVSVSGTIGKNKYFTSAVIITPPSGYLVADSLDGNYSSSLIVNSSRNAGYFYFMNIATGEKTAGIWSDGFLIDAVAPSIDAIAGKTYYAEYVEVAIKDENLSKITINGEEIKDLSEETTTLKLQSEGGMKKYKISVTDLAGNTETINIVVAADWVKSGVLPSGESVNLISGYQYKLGSGEWTVEGDATSYNGNIAFYVKEEGEYTFSKQ